MMNWVKEITDVGYEIEDLIDLIKYKNEIRRRRKGFIGSVSRFAHFPGEIITLHKVGGKIDKIKAKLEDISNSKDRYGIISTGNRVNEESGVDEMINIERFHSPHFVDDIDVVGFDGYMQKLIARLLNKENPARSVVSITGMGGLGKTTLARKVFNCPQVKENFPTVAWIAVSQKNTLLNLLREIAKQVMDLGKGGPRRSEGESSSSLSIQKMNQMDVLELKSAIFEFLKGRKYLVVLDDVWSTDDWEKISHIFPDDNNGSKILLTTRDMNVVKHADPRTAPLELQVLGQAESWELLHRNIFPRNHQFKVDQIKELEALGQKLAIRCGGLPLALVVLGGLLRRNVDYDSWSEILDTMHWESMTNGQRCLEILALSYKDLPNYQIKSCFLYISTFPKDCLISPAKLIRLWIAEGFIPNDERSALEETAKGYFNILIQRSLVQVAKRSKTGKRVKKIRIHDVLRDWCTEEAQKSGFLNTISSEKEIKPSLTASNDNRVAIHNTNLDDLHASSLGNARTILTFGLNSDGKSRNIFDHFNLLRVLDLQGSSGIQNLPEKIGELIHLRYMGVRNTEVTRLPSSIGQLPYLQTFDARGTKITKVPISFWKIQSLMYVYLPCFSDNVPRNEITQNLHKLYMGCTLINHRIKWLVLYNFLQKQNKLVSLTIDVAKGLLEKNETNEKKEDANIECRIPLDVISLFRTKKDLQFLKLYGEIGSLHSRHLGRFYHENLTELTLKMSNLEIDPMEVLGKLPRLMLLRLGIGSYEGTSLHCYANNFPQLKHLSLEWKFISKTWDVQDSAMPKLATLHINGCFYMDKIAIGLQHLTALKELRLSDIPPKIEKRVMKEGADWLIIRHIPSINLRRAW
ncbi:NBS-LRR disease resistance protein [Rhynchospora pubera]|uniref:NBS-LRR disease resistance protein n=1 Tax=Rhynchospora pubera TaxID=906938 RepID=A0AAV8E231_9POAL|nr:NBS-LRR disease resistance protein [Rhynchospora pubera]